MSLTAAHSQRGRKKVDSGTKGKQNDDLFDLHESSVLSNTQKVKKNAIRTKHNIRIFVVIPLIKLQNDNLSRTGQDKNRHVVYDILPPTTAIADYAIGLEKLSANEEFFHDAQMAASSQTKYIVQRYVHATEYCPNRQLKPYQTFLL